MMLEDFTAVLTFVVDFMMQAIVYLVKNNSCV